MTNFSRGSFAAASSDQFVITPKSAIDQDQIAGGRCFGPFGIAPREGGSNKDAFSFLLKDEAKGSVFDGKSALKFFADVIRIRAAERYCDAEEGWRFTGTFREMTTEASFAGKHLPLHGRISAVKNAENFVLLFQNALHGGRGEHEKGLKLAQVQEAHHGVDVRRRKENASDGRVRF